MIDVTEITIEDAATSLKSGTGRWVREGIPSLDGHIKFEADGEQFQLIQEICSGAKLGPNLGASVQYLLDRENELATEASEHDGCLPNNYCASGWVFHPGDEECESTLYLWYETTSGTVLCHAAADSGELFEVYLPSSRKMGNHLCPLFSKLTPV